MAVPRVWGVNPTRLTRWNEPDGDDLCLDSAFVSDNVHVDTTVVNKRHPRCVHGTRASGIVGLILGHCSCRDSQISLFVESGAATGWTNLLKASMSPNWPLAIVVLVKPTGSVAMAGVA